MTVKTLNNENSKNIRNHLTQEQYKKLARLLISPNDRLPKEDVVVLCDFPDGETTLGYWDGENWNVDREDCNEVPETWNKI